MLPFGVTIPATVPQRSEIPKGLTNYPVYCIMANSISSRCLGLVLDLVELNKVN